MAKKKLFDDYTYDTANPLMIGIVGKGNQGKTYSLQQMAKDMGDKIGYINTDRKPIPFKEKLRATAPNTPEGVIKAIKYINGKKDIQIGVLDTLTHAMDMYKNQHVVDASDTRKAWGDYANFYHTMIGEIKQSTKPWIVFFHETIYEADNGEMIHSIPVQGAVGQKGVETDFTTILTSTTITTKKIKKFMKKNPGNEYLHISDYDNASGIKRVFRTRNTVDALKGLSRSQADLWKFTKPDDELYIDNNLSTVIEHIIQYYE